MGVVFLLFLSAFVAARTDSAQGPTGLGSPLLRAALTLGTGSGPAAGHTFSCQLSSSAAERCATARPASGAPTWTNLTPTAPWTNPPGFTQLTLVYDSADHYVVAFDGTTTWTFADGTWTNISATAGGPGGRVGMAIADDPLDGYVLAWGGTGICPGSPLQGLCNDTWAFHAGTWTRLTVECNRTATVPTPNCAQLSPSTSAQATFDAADGYVILHEAISGAGGFETWTYFNRTWTDRDYTASNVSIPQTDLGAIAYDAAAHEVVGFAVTGNVAFQRPTPSAGPQADTYIWKNLTWVNVTATTTGAPPARFDPQLVFDASDGFLLMYGGWTGSCSAWAGNFCSNASVQSLHDAWEYANGSWRAIAGTTPSARWGAGIAFDAMDGSVLLAGGIAWSCGKPTCYLTNAGLETATTSDVWAFGTTPPIAALTLAVSSSTPDKGTPVGFAANFAGGAPPIAYTWDFGDGNVSFARNATHTFLRTGTFAPTFWANDSFGHRVTGAVTVSVQGALGLGVSAAPNPADAGLPVDFFATPSGGTPPYAYSWVFGDGGRSSLPSPSHVYPTLGLYTARLWVNDSGGATQTNSTLVTVNSALRVLNVSASPLPAVLGERVNFSAMAGAGTAPYSVAWAFGDGGVGGDLLNITHIYTTNGPFIATATFTDGAGGVATGSVNVTIALNATVSSNATLGAAPLVVGFTSTVVGGTPGYTYQWTFDDGTSSTSANPAHEYTQAGMYAASLLVTDRHGRTAMSVVPLLVAAGGGPLTLTVSPSASSIPLGGSLNVTASPSGGVGRYALEWTSLPGACRSLSVLQLACVPAASGTYNVTARLTDAAGNVQTATATIVVGTAVGPRSTPNGSGPGGIPLLDFGIVAAVGIALAATAGYAAGHRGGPPTAVRRSATKDRYAGYRSPSSTTVGTVPTGPEAAAPDALDDLF